MGTLVEAIGLSRRFGATEAVRELSTARTRCICSGSGKTPILATSNIAFRIRRADSVP